MGVGSPVTAGSAEDGFCQAAPVQGGQQAAPGSGQGELAEQPQPNPATAPAAPTRAAQPADTSAQAGFPGLEQADVRLRVGRLLPEGTFITRRAGRLVALPSGERALVFHPDEQGVTLRPMVLIPSLARQRMEQAVEDRELEFLVSGEVFVHHGLNYLLPTGFTLTAPRQARPVPSPALPPQPAPPDPSVEELIRELERLRQRQEPEPGRELPPRVAEPALRASAAQLMPEGQILMRRRGRMIRLAGGEWAIAFDSGPDQEPVFDRPLVLTPSLNLQRMQGWAGRAGDATSLEISGRITQYRGRNYLIPTLFRVYPATTALEPMQ
jgi:hypothetical protein